MTGVRLCGRMDVPAVNLTQGDQVLWYKTQRGAPMLAHGPSVVPITRCAEADVAIGAAQTLDAPGQAVRHTGNG